MKNIKNIVKGFVVLSIIPISWLFIHPVSKTGKQKQPEIPNIVNVNAEKQIKNPNKPSKMVIEESVVSLLGSSYVMEINFYGDAQKSSKFEEKELFLQTQKEKGWAYAQINFAQPVDLLNNSLNFMVKAKSSGLKLQISLTDVNKWTTVASDNYCVDLTQEWQRVIIKAEDLRDLLNIDKTKITNIKLIVEQHQDVENIYQISIKDLKLVEKSN